MTDLNPLDVSCPDCLAPEGEDCRFANPAYVGNVHANRRDRARWRLAIPGTCALCSQAMLKAADPDDAWHPSTVERACPPEPSTDPYDIRGWQEFINAGYSTGRPGLEHFIPDTTETLAEEGRKLASERDDLIAQGVDPAVLEVPLHPDDLAPVDLPNAICPECTAGKHRNCNGQAWDPVANDIGVCTCTSEEHIRG